MRVSMPTVIGSGWLPSGRRVLFRHSRVSDANPMSFRILTPVHLPGSPSRPLSRTAVVCRVLVIAWPG